MIHHVSVGTNDVRRARAFYDPLMTLIGFRVLKASERSVHYGASDIVFSLETPVNGKPASPGNGVHIAFQAPDRETVRRFHSAAVANGGSDEGGPGIRDDYNANYYGAFVRDLDGNKIETVTYTGRESFGL
ncbi:VOC family protein [Bradyrhizobium commune]|uniref:VOC family protein n=1 Tax=Bradyrhizobium commune TaxID=83627 RepID=A0A7S9D2B7_9BRAD|nr:VOC family protein [Bradyrhizobium commune]QPF89915.1 VOC family protein [Bradyrhizobium commune]